MRWPRSGARAVVVTPAHQWPTGVVLSPARRLELVRWAGEQDGYVVEDDYDAEFRYDHDPVGAVQGLAPDRVVLIGTVSKSLAPAVRLGWMVAPAALVDRIGELKLHHDRGSSGLEQLVLARLLESGRFDRHLRRMRKVYAGKRDALVEALTEHAPAARLTGLAAGFHAVLDLPPGADEEAVVAEAARRKIGLYGMGPYRTARTNVGFRSWSSASGLCPSGRSARGSRRSETCSALRPVAPRTTAVRRPAPPTRRGTRSAAAARRPGRGLPRRGPATPTGAPAAPVR